MTVRIAVYAPALNEAHNVEAWSASAANADEIVLVDTGSTDDTMAVARAVGVRVGQVCISPWRFDDGMNAALAHVSRDIDIAVPLHLDERLGPGWREELDRAWLAGGRQFTFRYRWTPGVEYRHDRIHARHGYRWKYPAHECPVGPGPRVDTDVVVTQVEAPGCTTRDDSALVHLMLAENPDDPRALYYSARQHYYANAWPEARATFARYLANPAATYGQERAEACRMMAKMVWPHHQESWLLRACAEAPQRREVWADLAVWYDAHGSAIQAFGALARARSITEVTPDNAFHVEAWAWDDGLLVPAAAPAAP